jgi:hypothetical protein
MKRTFAIVALFAGGSTMLGIVSADAATTQQFSRIPISYSYQDIGCRQTDTIHVDGEMLAHAVFVNGSVHAEARTTGRLSFAETGERFAGHFSLTSAFEQWADGSVAATQTFTTAAQGDQGDTAILHVTAHATYHAATDSFSADVFSVAQSCVRAPAQPGV